MLLEKTESKTQPSRLSQRPPLEMPKMKKPALDETADLVRATLSVEGTMNLDETVASIQRLRGQSAETAVVVDRTLVETLAVYRRSLKTAQQQINHCRELLE